jgi:cytochrome c biogenesis protein CcdA
MDFIFHDIQAVIQQKHLVAYFLVFTGGLISSASPCVLAAIPLIIGYVGGYSEGNSKKSLLYSFVYVIGLSVTFTLLGATASMLGSFLGFAGTWLYVIFAVIIILIGLQLTGIISLPLSFNKININIKTKGILGAFILGLITGILSSPCATPVLAVILGYVATDGNIIYGSSLLFVYAIGHCILIFIAGLSVGFTQKIISSKSVHNFADITKKISGIIFILAGCYIFYKYVV